MWISLKKDDDICHLININKVLGVCRSSDKEIVISSHAKTWTVQFESADGVNSADAAMQTIQDDFAVNIVLEAVSCTDK